MKKYIDIETFCTHLKSVESFDKPKYAKVNDGTEYLLNAIFKPYFTSPVDSLDFDIEAFDLDDIYFIEQQVLDEGQFLHKVNDLIGAGSRMASISSPVCFL